MDSMRRTVDPIDDLPADAPGIEPPPMIDGDERRMHVRAYNFWAKLLAGRSFPSIEALDTEELGDFGANSVLLDFTSGIENPAIAYVGGAIARECDLDDSIQYIGDVPRRSLLSRLTDHYLQIIANRAPIGFEAEFVNERGQTILYRGVLLPFSSDDDTIDFILGVINWKQAAEPELAQSLSEEMTALVPPHARPTVPVWADGPVSTGMAEPDEAASLLDGMDSWNVADGNDEGRDDEDALLLDTPAAEAEALPIPEGAADAASSLADAMADDFDPASASLADWLALAREEANAADQANARGRTALYAAIGRAWQFACVAARSADDYAELLEEAGIATSERSPMTPVARLVFGATYDKTRIAEIACILSHAAEQELGPDELAGYLARQSNGIKGLVREIRAARRGQQAPRKAPTGPLEQLRRAVPLAQIELPYVEDEAEFAVMVARRLPDGSHVVVATVGDGDPQFTRTLVAAAKGLKRRS